MLQLTYVFFFFFILYRLEISLMADYLRNDRTKNFEDILGPLPSNKGLFRNKHFILTCTIPIKVPITAMASHTNGTNGFHIVRVFSVFLYFYMSYRIVLNSRQTVTRTAMVMVTTLISSARSISNSVLCLL